MALEKTLAIFGHPLGHTMSPTLHNTAAEALGAPYRFQAYDVPPAGLKDAVHGARAMGFGGLCITIPHKMEVASLMNELSDDARLTGAVNVITFEEDGRMIGHNTDGTGWLHSLRAETGAEPAGKRCLILGSGGAARAVAVKLAQCGAAHIEIRNRTPDKAKALARYLMDNAGAASAAGGPLADLEAAAADKDIIVNTTSQGMTGDPEREAASAIPEAAIPSGCICTDAVYNPLETAFLQAARRRGAQTVRGVGWLVEQGAAAWKLWTGTDMPTDLVAQKVREALGG